MVCWWSRLVDANLSFCLVFILKSLIVSGMSGNLSLRFRLHLCPIKCCHKSLQLCDRGISHIWHKGTHGPFVTLSCVVRFIWSLKISNRRVTQTKAIKNFSRLNSRRNWTTREMDKRLQIIFFLKIIFSWLRQQTVVCCICSNYGGRDRYW